ncbi:MAG: tRNA 2-thiouridine(34) synthase MnmA [Gammaproteobacteria bacterium]|nr:tRNA 2-thiouridine(34) synthase MnmA [Gammaproteobacteria bacterium]
MPAADAHLVVAISGGVDSSVSALRLKRAGYRVSAVFMKNWNDPNEDGHCRWEDDVADALEVCERLDIPLNTVDLSQAYWDSVFADFLAEYARGRTPNPDILCNREVKFKAFLAHAHALGGDYIATGHYARIGRSDGRLQLLKGQDHNKDQSYFLYTLGQSQLTKTLFPVGDLEKPQVRQDAQHASLITFNKKDSTGICFIGEQRFRTFLSRYLPAQPGHIRTLAGRTIGEHAGVVYYTLGQREGLRIGGVKGASEGAWYVVRKEVGANELIVAQGHDHPALLSQQLCADQLSWVAGEPPVTPFRCYAKTRYRQADQACVITELTSERVTVVFDQPQRAVTPGQSVVFYNEDVCLGGGIIDTTL